MERITISLDDELAKEFERYLEHQGYKNKSEAMRDLIREKIEQQSLEQQQQMKNTGDCVGSLTYIYNHHERELASKLAQEQHANHNIAVSTLRVHLDHDHCMETVMLSGETQKVRQFSNQIIARPGVRHGKAFLVPVEVEQSQHEGKIHLHSKPKT